MAIVDKLRTVNESARSYIAVGTVREFISQYLLPKRLKILVVP
jgi:hypothetical protein